MTISATEVRFDEDAICVGLSEGWTMGVPLVWFPRLLEAGKVARAAVEIWPSLGGGYDSIVGLEVFSHFIVWRRPSIKLAGEFKRDQNMIGARTLEHARFIPPPPRETLDCMSALEAFINDPSRGEELALIDIALTHYQFETIHPFADGNGRVGRMLISLMAVSRGLLELPALYMSPELERDKDEYIEKMYRVSAFGEWNEWLNFFFDATARTCVATISTIDRLIATQEDYRNRASEASTSVNLLTVVDMLFETPVVRAKGVVDRAQVTDAAARGLLNKLVELEILMEFDGVYPKAWIAMDLIRVTTPHN